MEQWFAVPAPRPDSEMSEATLKALRRLERAVERVRATALTSNNK